MPVSSSRSARLLMVRLSSFGDIVLAEPVARALKTAFPGSELAFAVYPEYAGLPEMFSSVDEVLTYSKRAAASGSDLAGRTFDIVVDLQTNRHSRRITGRVKAGRVLRYKRPRLGRFFTVYLPRIWKGPQPHTIKTYFRTLRPLGITYSGEVPRITPGPRILEDARAFLGPGAAVAICPGSSSEHKSWGDERFAHLVGLLEGKYRVLLAGSEHDRSAIEGILRRVGGETPAVYVGRDMSMIAGLLALCRVTVTNDSGLMHLAGAVGSRPVAIFGPTSPLLGFAPAAEGAVVLSMEMGCSPCSFHGNKPCRLDRRYCMEGITPDTVASVVGGIMEEE
jgi:heptosyltransferase-2